jgi:hypothetical protein
MSSPACRSGRFFSRPRRGFLVRALVAAAFAVLFLPQSCSGYSVFTHQELIDLAWDDSIVPLLRARFPGLTAAQLDTARAFAYGGSAIQDMGYYPFGDHFTSDLMHYVRTGDFVSALFRSATDVNEYAFAIGALSHYLGDNIGHSRAVNPAVAVQFPELRRKYGRIVTYDESPHSHIRTEFAFDIGQLSKQTFAPPSYLRSVGVRVPVRLLRRAFIENYGLGTRELFGTARTAVRSYRRAVLSFIPSIAGAEIVLHRKEFPPDIPGHPYRVFSERLSRADKNREWTKPYDHPGFGSHVLALVIRVVPKVGALSDLAIKIPKPTSEDWYVRSVNESVTRFERILDATRSQPDVAPRLENRDLDTGNVDGPGAYPLMDDTYAKLVSRLVSRPARTVPLGLRQAILDYYSDPDAPIRTRKNKKAWKKLKAQLLTLRQMTVAGAALP